MDNAIYQLMITANQLLEKQNMISNNLANIATNGFKEKFLLTIKNQNIKNLHNNDHQIIKEYYNLAPGTLHYTQRNLDLFIKDNGWLTVKDMNGQEAYTKNGHLQKNSHNLLTSEYYEVIGIDGNTIKVPTSTNIDVLSDGTISSKEKKNNQNLHMGRLKLVSIPSEDLTQKENGLFYLKKKNNLLDKLSKTVNYNDKIHVKSGILEESNVNISKNMIEMISNARQFEMQMKMISMCDQNAEHANQLMNVNN